MWRNMFAEPSWCDLWDPSPSSDSLEDCLTGEGGAVVARLGEMSGGDFHFGIDKLHMLRCLRIYVMRLELLWPKQVLFRKHIELKVRIRWLKDASSACTS